MFVVRQGRAERGIVDRFALRWRARTSHENDVRLIQIFK